MVSNDWIERSPYDLEASRRLVRKHLDAAPDAAYLARDNKRLRDKVAELKRALMIACREWETRLNEYESDPAELLACRRLADA